MDATTMIQGLRSHPAGDTFAQRAAQFQSRVSAARELAGEEQTRQLQKAAREFEAIFVAHLLKVMRETMEDSGLTGKGMGRTVYTELFDQEVARSISKTGAFGIADLLIRSIADPEKSPEEPGDAAVDPQSPSTAGPEDPATPARSHAPGRGERESEIPDFRMPLQAPVSSEFGNRKDPFTRETKYHRGIDIAAPEGMPVQAALGGRVVFSGYASGYGNTVVVEHGRGYRTRYAHLGSMAVRKGDIIKTEQVLGSVGSTGRSTGPHLHFEVSRYGERINPRTALAE
jgi:murein DD-endopeptidase MepM/ murein hydrolase activator NlpD